MKYSAPRPIVDQAHQLRLLGLVRDEEVDARRLQRAVVYPRRDRALRTEQAGAFSRIALRADRGRDGSHVEEGQGRLRLQAREEMVRGIAGHDHAVRPAFFEIAQGAEHLRHRVGPAGEDRGRAVGDGGVAVDIYADMVVVAVGLGREDDLFIEVHRGERPHAAEDADRFFHQTNSVITLIASRTSTTRMTGRTTFEPFLIAMPEPM